MAMIILAKTERCLRAARAALKQVKKLDEVPSQTVLKVKLAGAAFVVAGVVLALVAFR